MRKLRAFCVSYINVSYLRVAHVRMCVWMCTHARTYMLECLFSLLSVLLFAHHIERRPLSIMAMDTPIMETIAESIEAELVTHAIETTASAAAIELVAPPAEEAIDEETRRLEARAIIPSLENVFAAAAVSIAKRMRLFNESIVGIIRGPAPALAVATFGTNAVLGPSCAHGISIFAPSSIPSNFLTIVFVNASLPGACSALLPNFQRLGQ